jgi:hypothetical protein
MPKFKVSLHRKLPDPYRRDRNPFLAQLPPDGVTVQMSVRTWTFEATDIRHVKILLDEAYAADIGNVRGYTLRDIELVPDSQSDRGADHG